MWIAEVQTHVRRYHPVAINVFWLVSMLNSNTFYSSLLLDHSCTNVLCLCVSLSLSFLLLLDQLLYSWDM
ncbi:hypothetical protein COCC4DRAFT_111291, partial [Bipolaris maydis ATCC 48331]